MATKVKGLFKGLRHMSHMFEDGKEGDIQIGYPTDVKHVAHIGWDGHGPSAESPSWMKEFSSTGYQSAPLGITDPKEDNEIKWVSEDSKTCRPPPSRQQSSTDNSESPKKESSRRHSRRSKDSSGGSTKSNRQLQDPATGSESPSKSPPLPDIPKKSRRRKSKENVTGGSSSSTRSSRSKDKDGSVRSRKSEPSQPSIQEGEMESGANS